MNKDYLERIVKPCQEVRKTQLLINKFMEGYQFIRDLHEPNLQGDPDREVDVEYEIEEIITDMYDNKYPDIIPIDELGGPSRQKLEESPPRRARRERRYQGASNGWGQDPNYVLNNTLDVYIQRIDIPDDIKGLFQKIISDFKLNEEPIYGEYASITDFIGNLRMIEEPPGWSQPMAPPGQDFFPGFIEFIREQFKDLGNYSNLEVQQFVNKILKRLTDLL